MSCNFLKNETSPVCVAMSDYFPLSSSEVNGLCLSTRCTDCPRWKKEHLHPFPGRKTRNISVKHDDNNV